MPERLLPEDAAAIKTTAVEIITSNGRRLLIDLGTELDNIRGAVRDLGVNMRAIRDAGESVRPLVQAREGGRFSTEKTCEYGHCDEPVVGNYYHSGWTDSLVPSELDGWRGYCEHHNPAQPTLELWILRRHAYLVREARRSHPRVLNATRRIGRRRWRCNLCGGTGDSDAVDFWIEHLRAHLPVVTTPAANSAFDTRHAVAARGDAATLAALWCTDWPCMHPVSDVFTDTSLWADMPPDREGALFAAIAHWAELDIRAIEEWSVALDMLEEAGAMPAWQVIDARVHLTGAIPRETWAAGPPSPASPQLELDMELF